MNWKKLAPGDIVDCFAPSSGYPPCEREGIMSASKKWIESLGLSMRYPKEIFGDDMLYANNSDIRAGTAAAALTSEDSKVAWPIRGGYGAGPIMPKLASLMPKKALPQKLLVGFSDVTAIHMYVINQYNWSTIHWTNLGLVATGMVNPECMQIFKCIIQGKTPTVSYEVKPINDSARDAQKIQAKIFGGNLTILGTSIGTLWGKVPSSSIIFIEEVNEAATKVDRLLHHLLQAGYFDSAKALLIGEVTQGKGAGETDSINWVIKTFSNHIGTPCFRIKKIGHVPGNRPLPLNTEAAIRRPTKGGGAHILEIETGITL